MLVFLLIVCHLKAVKLTNFNLGVAKHYLTETAGQLVTFTSLAGQ